MEPCETTRARAEIFKALGHPSRLTLVEALASGERCVCELVELVPASQATVSRHLNVLVEAGVLRRRPEGVKMIYSLALPCLLEMMPCVGRAVREGASSRRRRAAAK